MVPVLRAALIVSITCACADASPQIEHVAEGASVSVIDTVPAAVEPIATPTPAESVVEAANPGWSVAALWLAGAAEGDGLVLGNITNVTVGPNGRIYAIDFTSQHITVLDPAGRHVRTLGRQGKGPVEFDGPLAMTWDSNGLLWVADGWNRRYTVFDTSGAFVRTVPRAVNGSSGWSQRLRFADDATLVDETSRTIGGKYHVQFLSVSTEGTILDSLASIPGVSAWPVGMDPGQVARAGEALRPLKNFVPRLILALDSAGNLWSAESDRYRLVERGPRGDTVRVIEGPRQSQSLTRGERDLIQTQMRVAGIDADALRIGKQVIQSMHLMAAGYILVQRETVTGTPSRTIDILFRDGAVVATVDLPATPKPATAWAIRGDTIVAVVVDEMDVNYIAKLVVKRN